MQEEPDKHQHDANAIAFVASVQGVSQGAIEDDLFDSTCIDEPPFNRLLTLGRVAAWTFPPLGFVLCLSAYVLVREAGGDARQVEKAKRGAVFAVFFGVGCLLMMTMFGLFYSPKFVCRSKQSEARIALKAIYQAQEAYQTEHGSYGALDLLFNDLNNRKRRYDYFLLSYDLDTYTAAAVGYAGEVDGDTWTIDHQKMIANTCNLCDGLPEESCHREDS